MERLQSTNHNTFKQRMESIRARLTVMYLIICGRILLVYLLSLSIWHVLLLRHRMLN